MLVAAATAAAAAAAVPLALAVAEPRGSVVRMATGMAKAMSYRSLYFFSLCREDGWEDSVRTPLVELSPPPELFLRVVCLEDHGSGEVDVPRHLHGDAAAGFFVASDLERWRREISPSTLDHYFESLTGWHWYLPDVGGRVPASPRLDSRVFTYRMADGGRSAQVSETYGVKRGRQRFSRVVGRWSGDELPGLEFPEPRTWERRKDFGGATVVHTTQAPSARKGTMISQAILAMLAVSHMAMLGVACFKHGFFFKCLI